MWPRAFAGLRSVGVATVIAVVVGVWIGGVGCSKGSGTKAGQSGSKACRPNEHSRIPKLMPRTDAEKTCKRDADCVLTRRIVGSCCGIGCGHGFAVTRVYEAILRQQWRRCCKGHKYECPVHSCPKATTRAVARCKAGRCRREVIPLTR